MDIHRHPAIAGILVPLVAACGGSGPAGVDSGGSASVRLDGTTYEVREVTLTIEPGEDAWYRIEGEPAAHPGEDCVPGLGGGLGLYGDLPASVREPRDLAGRRLRVDFSGDGDDANFCFVGMDALAGAEEAWVTIERVEDGRVHFSMSGTFQLYDEQGEGPIRSASASGTARLVAGP